MEANDLFWEVTVELYSEDERGKIKKNREVHLVDAPNVTEAEKKVKEEMDGTLSEYKIKAIRSSNICVVY